MAASDIKKQIEQYLADTLPDASFTNLWNSLQETDDILAWQQAIEEVLLSPELHDLSKASQREQAYEELKKLLQRTQPAPVVPVRKLKPQLIAVAAVFMMLLAGSYLFYSYYNGRGSSATATTHSGNDIMPGREGAILTLSDGTQMVLDNMENGVVATQNGTNVVLADGRLSYTPASAASGETMFNTITTPKGRQFNILLPDGSRVWLNAASALKYPTQFTGKERKVEVTGEAYFEITSNATVPFKVKLQGQEIEVLGTTFNVNAYTDENNISTTLLEGSIRVSTGNTLQNVVLKPGTQSQVFHRQPGTIKVVQAVNTEQVVAWKNGAFNFNDKTLEEVLRQLARWYDVEVLYEGDIPYKTFYGEMGRSLTLSECLKVLEKMQVHFRIEAGRRLVVMQ